MRRRTAWLFLPLLAAVALLIGWQAQVALSGPRPVEALPLFAAGIILFVSCCGAAVLRGAPPAVVPDGAVVKQRGAWRAPRLAAAAALLLAAGTLVLFWFGGHDDWGWTLHLSSMLVLLAGAIGRPRKEAVIARGLSLRAALRRRGGEWLLLLLILAVALVARVWDNGSVPPGLYYDEAREGVIARRILSEPSYRPVYIAYIERPAPHAYLVALSFAVFGDSISSLRLVPAAFGVLNVLAAYLLFSRWFARRARAGLIAAGLWAVTRYDLTFSRIVFDGDSTPFFMLLTLFFLDRGFGGRRKSDFVLAGLALGIGQGFYLPMRIFAVLLVALGLCLAAVRAWRERSLGFLKAWRPYLLLTFAALLLATAPVIEFALQSPGVFFDRNVSASIFAERAEPNLLLALAESTQKHLAMFNYQGDQNGRHNLPGAPMLDALSGVLFLFGLGLAVRGWRDRRNFVMLVLFGGMLQAGILSTDWEAPQVLRSIGVLPSVIYFMTLALAALAALLARWWVMARAWRTSRQIQPRPRTPLPGWALPFAVLAATLLIIGWLNLDFYFNHQAKDALVWRAHSPGEVWTASEMRRLAPAREVILPARYDGSPTIQYLAPGIAPSRIFTITDALPLSPPPARPAVLFLDSTLKDQVDRARRAYPAAPIRELRPPDNSDPVVYEIILDR